VWQSAENAVLTLPCARRRAAESFTGPAKAILLDLQALTRKLRVRHPA